LVRYVTPDPDELFKVYNMTPFLPLAPPTDDPTSAITQNSKGKL